MNYRSLLISFSLSALKLHSPVRIMRSLDDVHTNCERDIDEFCNKVNTDEIDEFSLLPRRLTDVGPDAVPISRLYSVTIGLRITPKVTKDLTQRVKDNKRFLNYGPNKDICLWNAFDAEQVSSQCASALTEVNDITNYPQIEYTNESDYKYISVPIITLLLLTLSYILIREIYSEADDNKGDQINDNDKMDSEHYEYQVLDKSKKMAHIAVPLEAI